MGRRKKIGRTEKRRCDRSTAARLLDLREAPRRVSDRVFVDVQCQVGRVIRRASLRERWVFAAAAVQRAADFVLSFEKFAADGADLSDLRHVVLRPRGHKVRPEDLDTAIRELSKQYDKHVGKLVSEKLVQPIASVIQFRYCLATKCIDLHCHAVWRVAPAHMDAVFKAIQTKFSTTWISTERIRKPAALINYLASGVIDHRTIASWSNEALLAVWSLTRAKLLRPSGAFQSSRRGLKGFRLVRRSGEIQAVPVKARPPRATDTPRQHKPGATIGYVQVKLDDVDRWCAIVAVKPGGRLTNRQVADVVGRSRCGTAARPRYPTTETGPTPPDDAGMPQAPPLEPAIAPRDSQVVAVPPAVGCCGKIDPTHAATPPSAKSLNAWKPLKIAVSGIRSVWSLLSRGLSRIVRRNE